MLSLTAATRIYLSRAHCDVRRSFDGLCGITRSEINQYPLSGSLFVFCNRRRTPVRLLYWDSGGLAIWFKRLERGSFGLPRMDVMDGRTGRRDLILLLKGVVPKEVIKSYILEP